MWNRDDRDAGGTIPGGINAPDDVSVFDPVLEPLVLVAAPLS